VISHWFLKSLIESLSNIFLRVFPNRIIQFIEDFENWCGCIENILCFFVLESHSVRYNIHIKLNCFVIAQFNKSHKLLAHWTFYWYPRLTKIHKFLPKWPVCIEHLALMYFQLIFYHSFWAHSLFLVFFYFGKFIP